MAAPARWVIAGAIASCRCPIEYRLDAPAHSARRFRLLCPNRLDSLHHEAGIDGGDGQPTDMRIDVGFERRRPLRGVLGVTPARLMRLDVGLAALPEGHRL